MAELEDLREQKLAELKQRLEQQQAEAEKQRAAEQKIDVLLKRMLSQDAKSRLKNVKLVNQDLYWSAVQQLLLLYRAGRIKGTATEEDVKRILKQLSQKREIKITRK